MKPLPWLRLLARTATVFVLLVGPESPCAENRNSQVVRHGQESPLRSPREEIEQRVLDLAFPVERRSFRNRLFTFVLRFRPSFSPERQIAIRYSDKWVASVDYRAAGVQLTPLLDEILATNRSPNALEIAGRMKVKRKLLPVPAETSRKWFQDFWKALGESLEAVKSRGAAGLIQLDGTRYSCRYEDMLSRWSLEVSDSELGSPDSDKDLPLVRWMNGIRRQVEGLAHRGEVPADAAPGRPRATGSR